MEITLKLDVEPSSMPSGTGENSYQCYQKQGLTIARCRSKSRNGNIGDNRHLVEHWQNGHDVVSVISWSQRLMFCHSRRHRLRISPQAFLILSYLRL